MACRLLDAGSGVWPQMERLCRHEDASTVNLRNVDLNLLPILEALLSERSVSRAGERVGLSQSATSAALGRLRILLKDPLLVPVGRGMTLTARAEGLVAPLQDAIAAIEGTLSRGSGFDPLRDTRTFSIAASDYAVLVLLAPLVRTLYAEAPNVTIHLLPRSSDVSATLRTGRADIVIEPDARVPGSDLASSRLFTDRWLCAVDRRSAIAARGRITREEFCTLPHLIYSVGPDRQLNLADQHLSEAGIVRRIEVMVESFLLAPFLMQETELVSLVLERAVRSISGDAAVATVPPPFNVPDLAEAMYWLPRNTPDQGHAWLRERISIVAARIADS